MAQPAKSRSTNARLRRRVRYRRAFLLIEATITAAVIGIGLVVVSRGIGGSLKALAVLQQYDRLVRLADSQLTYLEAQAQHAPLMLPAGGTFEAPETAYQWSLTRQSVSVSPQELADTLVTMTLTVSRANTPNPVARLTTVWPVEWLAQ